MKREFRNGNSPQRHPARTSAALRGARNAPATTRLFRSDSRILFQSNGPPLRGWGDLFPALTRRLRAGLTRTATSRLFRRRFKSLVPSRDRSRPRSNIYGSVKGGVAVGWTSPDAGYASNGIESSGRRLRARRMILPESAITRPPEVQPAPSDAQNCGGVFGSAAELMPSHFPLSTDRLPWESRVTVQIVS